MQAAERVPSMVGVWWSGAILGEASEGFSAAAERRAFACGVKEQFLGLDVRVCERARRSVRSRCEERSA